MVKTGVCIIVIWQIAVKRTSGSLRAADEAAALTAACRSRSRARSTELLGASPPVVPAWPPPNRASPAVPRRTSPAPALAGAASELPGSDEAPRASRWLDVAPKRGAPLPPDLPVHVGWLTGAVCRRHHDEHSQPIWGGTSSRFCTQHSTRKYPIFRYSLAQL